MQQGEQSSHPRYDPIDAWVRWGWVWHVTMGLVLGFALLFTVLNTSIAPQSRSTLLLLYSLLCLWYLLMTFIPVVWTREHILVTFALFAALWVLWFMITSYNLMGLMLLGLIFPNLYLRLPMKWAIAGSLITGVMGSYLMSGGNFELSPDVLLGSALMVLGAIPLGLYINAITRQSLDRKALIEELQSTRADLARAGRQAGALAERERLSNEIHDRLAQGFTSIIMQLEAAEAALDQQPEQLRQHLQLARDTARASLGEARDLVWALRPELQASSALPESLARMGAQWAAGQGIEFSSSVTGQPVELPPQVEVLLLRALREALNNVARHARARQVTVTLSYMGDMLALDVEDDGLGFDAEQAVGEGNGFGLRSLRHDLAALKGEVTLESRPGGGATLAVSLPLTRPTPE